MSYFWRVHSKGRGWSSSESLSEDESSSASSDVDGGLYCPPDLTVVSLFWGVELSVGVGASVTASMGSDR